MESVFFDTKNCCFWYRGGGDFVMIPEELKDITIADLVLDVICAISGIVVLDVCLRNIVELILKYIAAME